MRELLVVLRREFVERVRARSFIWSTILTPVLLTLFALGPSVTRYMQSGGDQRLVVVDETTDGIGGAVRDALAASSTQPADDTRFQVTLVRTPLATVEDSLKGALVREEIDGYLWIPADVLTRGQVVYRAEGTTPGILRRRLSVAVTTAVQTERLERTGIDPRALAAALLPVEVEATRLTAAGGAETSSTSGLVFAMIVGFFLYFLILLYGAQVMQSVQEEKTSRISEVLVSTIRAPYLMLGKVLGVGSAALLQVAIWVSFATLLATVRGRVVESLGIPPGVLEPFSVGADAGAAVIALLYMLLGFFLYATLFAAAGAAAASTEDAQRFTFPLIMPLIIPMIFAEPIVTAPTDTLAVALGWFPFTAPLVMPMRIGANGATPLEVGGTLLVLLLSVGALGWVAGKIYRVGILSTGKRPSLRDLAHWIRTA